MAKPQKSYPGSATNGARKEAIDEDGDAALRQALAAHGDDLAAAVDRTDDLEGVLTTAILVASTADEDELDHVTSSAANLVRAADGLTTEGAASLATQVGDSADDLAASLDTVTELQREGHLDDLVTIATAFAESLSPEEVEELATVLEENGTDVVEALDVVLELQREGHLADLVETAKVISTLEIDETTARGLNDFFAAVGDAQRESEPIGPLEMLRGLTSRDARAGMGYLLAILKAQGRRLRRRR
jgi:uncharacterized protein YjgD (DUF1641 family)